MTQGELEGILERIVFQAPDDAYIVGRLQVPDRRDPVTILGRIAASPGETLRLRGHWSTHRRYGPQFRVERYESLLPSSAKAIEKFLGSGLIHGIGPVLASRIVATFGRETLAVLDGEPGRLLDVEGIGETRLETISAAWRKQQAVREVVLFLQEFDVSPVWAVRILRACGAEALSMIRENPFRLASEVPGIGFRTADRIAEKSGIPKDAAVRIEEGLAFVLSEKIGEGNVFCPDETLFDGAAGMLDVGRDLLPSALQALSSGNRVVVDGGRVYPTPLFHAERGIADRLARLMGAALQPLRTDPERAIDRVAGKMGLELAPHQREAIRSALTTKILVITGNPGCGKSTLVRGIVDIYADQGRRVLLGAPTGRAAKRLSELTGLEARTIHRLLEFRKGAFQRHDDHPLDADLVVVDEASMIDTVLLNQLLKAVPTTASFILVGDVDQLPSVGPGTVLRDLIVSGVIPVVRLTEIFRQAASSMIVVNAHRINRGERPVMKNDDRSDFFFIEEEDSAAVARQIVSLVADRLPRHYGVDPVRDIQVLCPMHRGDVGVSNLNGLLQDQLNPATSRETGSARRFRPGDKVLQRVNNYDLDVFNGDIGVVTGANEEMGEWSVDFDGRTVVYDAAGLDELALAWACSVHKSQGSEYPVVVLPVHTQHYIMLQRNLLYTAVTRARRVCVLVGSRKALAIALRNNRVTERHTALAERLQGARERTG